MVGAHVLNLHAFFRRKDAPKRVRLVPPVQNDNATFLGKVVVGKRGFVCGFELVEAVEAIVLLHHFVVLHEKACNHLLLGVHQKRVMLDLALDGGEADGELLLASRHCVAGVCLVEVVAVGSAWSLSQDQVATK